MASTFSPDPPRLLAGPGTADEQTARAQLLADHANGGWDDAPIAATGAVAGIPGTWTPPGSAPPANVAALQSSSITATPATAWTIGQYMQTATAGVGGQAYWNGTAWTAGTAP
jgi:hypothetical protein